MADKEKIAPDKTKTILGDASLEVLALQKQEKKYNVAADDIIDNTKKTPFFEVGAMLEEEENQDSDNNVNDGSAPDTMDEKFRSLEEDRKNKNDETSKGSEAEIDDYEFRRDGYVRDREISYEDKKSEHQEEEKQIESDLTRPDRYRERKRLGAFLAWKLFIHKAFELAKDTIRRMDIIRDFSQNRKNSPEETRKNIEKISTYRHHTIVAPGNQAGIFDDMKEAAVKRAQQEAKKLVKEEKSNSLEIPGQQEARYNSTFQEVDKKDIGFFTHNAIHAERDKGGAGHGHGV